MVAVEDGGGGIVEGGRWKMRVDGEWWEGASLCAWRGTETNCSR